MRIENNGAHRANVPPESVSELLQLNNRLLIKASFATLDASPKFIESVAAPVVTKLIEGGEAWQAEPLVALLDSRLRRYSRRARGGVSYQEIYREYGADIVNAVVKSPEDSAQALEVWNARVEKVARTHASAGEKRRAIKARQQKEALQKRLGRSSLAKLTSWQKPSPRTTSEKIDTKASKPVRQKQTAKGTKPRRGASRRQKAVRGGSQAGAKSVYKQSSQLSKRPRHQLTKKHHRSNGDRGYAKKAYRS